MLVIGNRSHYSFARCSCFNTHTGGTVHERERQQSAPQECPVGSTSGHFTSSRATRSHIIPAAAVVPNRRRKWRCRRGGRDSLRLWRRGLRAGGGSDPTPTPPAFRT